MKSIKKKNIESARRGQLGVDIASEDSLFQLRGPSLIESASSLKAGPAVKEKGATPGGPGL